MSEHGPDHDHANHAYSFEICDHFELDADMDEALYFELKAEFREALRKLMGGDPGPWSYNLMELASRYRIESLHEIPERVHRELIQGWLDRLNKKRGPREQLFLSMAMAKSCCHEPPKLWHACTQGEALIGADARSAQPLLIKVTAPKAKITKGLPVYIGACWTCETTRDGRPEPGYSKSDKKLA